MQDETTLPIGPATVGLLTNAEGEEPAIADMSVVEFMQELFAAIESQKVTTDQIEEAASEMGEDEILFLIGGIMRRVQKGGSAVDPLNRALTALAEARTKNNDRTTAVQTETKLVDQWQKRFDRAFDGIDDNMTIKASDLLLSHVKAGGGMTGDDGVRIEVKDASHQYSDVKYVAKHAKSGQPVFLGGEEIRTTSQREHALLGVWMKQWVAREQARDGGATYELTEHERDLLRELYAKHGFRRLLHEGASDESEEYVKGERVKALINDGTSGGQELVPEYFDNALVQYPLLHSEVLPYVDIKDVPRGSSVETAAVGNPTVSWNQAEASAIGMFDTSGLVSEIAASIYTVMIAIELGLDLMGDTPASIGQVVEENIGQRMMAEFDQVITSGDGTTQPQGIDLASGTTDVTAANPTTGAVTVADLLNLIFAVGKQYRMAAYRPRFVMTDTTYKRFRSVATGVTGDSRFHLGDNVNSYSLLDWPVSIDNTGLTNSQVIFGAMSKYRFWRRKAPIVRRSMVGDTNLRRNTMTVVVRSRVGGKVVDGNAFAICDSLPA